MSRKPSEYTFSKDPLYFAIRIDLKCANFRDDYFLKKGFNKKDELHITIITTDNGRKIKRKIKQQKKDFALVTVKIERLTKKFDWSFSIKKGLYLVRKRYSRKNPASPGETINETRNAIIQFVKVPDVAEFYVQLEKILGFEISIPPSHITLYTKGKTERSKFGIGINSSEELENMKPKLIE